MKPDLPLSRGRFPAKPKPFDPPVLAAVSQPRPDTLIAKKLRDALLAREGSTKFKRRGQGR